MDIDLLKTFLEVNNTRHFGRAADNLYITPAAVSARVRQLEQLLGVDLFIRSRNNIQLTLEGERLVPHAETMLLSWSRALQDVSYKVDQNEHLTMGADDSFWNFSLGQSLPGLLQALPGIGVSALSLSADVLVRRLIDQTLDVIFLLEPPPLQDFKVEKMGQIKLVLVSGVEGASLKTALQSAYVLVDWGVSFEMFHAKRFGNLPTPSWHTNRGGIALQYLQHVDGAAYLPQTVLDAPLARPLHPVSGAPTYSRPLFAVYRASSDRLALIEQAITLLKLPTNPARIHPDN